MKIGNLIRGSKKPFFSLEFFPPATDGQMPAFFDTVDELARLKPLFVSVTYGAGGAKQQNTLAVTEEMAKRGLNAMAHLTCVGAEPETIRAFLGALRERGVDNVLALRGDPPKNRIWNPEGEIFRHAVDLVKFIKKEFPDMGIGVAAYPSPHPESKTFWEDRRYTARKLGAGADFAVSQLFFDPREYAELVRVLDEAGVHVPVIPGILPIQSFASLRRVLSLCGANIPAKLYLALEDAHAKGGEEAVREVGLNCAVRQIKELLEEGAPGIHLYTLNKSGMCKTLIVESGLA